MSSTEEEEGGSVMLSGEEEEEEIESGSEQSQSGGDEEGIGDFRILSESATSVQNVGAVVGQLKLWDQLMAARIKMQQVIKLTNCLAVQTPDNASGNKDFKKNATLNYKRAVKMQTHLQTVTNSLLASLDVEGNANFDLNHADALWQPILEQWWNKTCLPQVDTKAKAKSSFTQLEESPVKYARRLMTDKNTLIRRTQLKRLDYHAGGCEDSKANNDDEYDCRVFDDNDFYQVLIRDIISKKLAATNDPSAMARTMLSGEKLTADIFKPKKKQAVDRRASKGRKIRYNVMPKLVNYMGPDNSKISWTDQQCDELFKSLFQ